MREGDRVRVTGGEHKGKIGIVIGLIPMSQVQHLEPGQDISMKDAKEFWLIQFDDGDEQTLLEEKDFEIYTD